jgi:hypothetical protein
VEFPVARSLAFVSVATKKKIHLENQKEKGQKDTEKGRKKKHRDNIFCC